MKREHGAWCLRIVGALSLVVVASTALAQQWTPLNPPVSRIGHTAVLNPNNNTMVVFGGLPQSSPNNLNDTWWLTNADGPALTWALKRPTGTVPAGRFWHSAVYDSTTDRMIVFGGALGRSSPCANDVWVLASATGTAGNPSWIQLSPAGTLPSARSAHSAMYDPNTNTMIVYGGNDCFPGDSGDVWVLSNANGLTGTPTWTQLSPVGGPPAGRSSTAAAYDPASNRMVIFGGESSGVILGDLWVLTNANGTGGTPTWIQLNPTGTSPGPLTSTAHTFDAASDRLTIFGGYNGTADVNTTWVLSNANGLATTAWTQLAPAHPPSARGSATGVYNPTTNDMTIFGGSLTAGSYINSVLVLSHANGLGPEPPDEDK